MIVGTFSLCLFPYNMCNVLGDPIRSYPKRIEIFFYIGNPTHTFDTWTCICVRSNNVISMRYFPTESVIMN